MGSLNGDKEATDGAAEAAIAAIEDLVTPETIVEEGAGEKILNAINALLTNVGVTPVTTCPGDCHGHGECVCPPDNGGEEACTCECAPGWSGPDCQVKKCLNDCNGQNGVCDKGVCVCHEGFSGPDCGQISDVISCQKVCMTGCFEKCNKNYATEDGGLDSNAGPCHSECYEPCYKSCEVL